MKRGIIKVPNYGNDCEYSEHYPGYRKSQVYCMCKPVTNIRGKTAQELLQMCKQTDSVPVDLKSMLQQLNISCMSYDFSKLDAAFRKANNDCLDNPILGAFVTNGDKAVILYRDKDLEDGHRYRFTIAHELAHACLEHYSISHKSAHLAFRREQSDNKHEHEANIFAGELLIPQQSLDRVLKLMFLPSVDYLADIFAVSKRVMYARLTQLNITKNIIGYNC